MSTDLVQHAFHGQSVRVITDEHGDPWFVAADVATILGYRMASDMTRRLDDDDRGTRSVRTPSADQQMTVITEAGLYVAVLGSMVPGAKEFKRWVTHEVLPTIRRTGSYATPVLTGPELMATALLEAAKTLEQKDARIAELTPSAHSWDALVADTGGDWSMRDAAQILSRDPEIEIGQNRLAKLLREIHWIDRQGIPYQAQVNTGRMSAKPQTRLSHRTGERIACDPQARVTLKGLGWLHSHLGGVEPLDATERRLTVAR
ncbi:BRO family protein [Occultella gossypii]|uniref:Phage antirepressor KilAC domain-containing protein n=1 Tax=Occultella gossypii TaxID=2800820 RepID=A0ABS7SAE8_9MICO|nr:BRO family protein [Occultella gossypii]MBZ2197242.1 phage antirepressor KilAC domain-containing protein [Occultella gossypii]